MSTSKGTRRPALEAGEPESGHGDLSALESFFDTDPTEVPGIGPGADRRDAEIVVADDDAESTGADGAPAEPSTPEAGTGGAGPVRGRREPLARWRHDPDVLRRVLGAVVVVALAAVCVAVALHLVG
jgi:hypothetical protein